MSVFDKLKGMLKGHEDQASKGVDQAGDLVDKKTQGKYAGHVDTAQEKLRGQLGDTGTRPDSPPQPPPPPQQ